MRNFLKQREWGWLPGGMALAAIFLLAAWLVTPIGVSTQYVIVDGLLLNSVTDLVQESPSNSSGFASDNALLNKSGGKYAEDIAHPLTYGLVFVFAMIFGGFLGKWSSARDKQPTVSHPTSGSEYLRQFVGGFLVLFGARLAGGCTSGHMMSGMMQTSVSGYAFAFSVFLIAIPTTLLLKKLGEK